MSTYTFIEKRHKNAFRILSKGRVSLVVSGMLLGTTVSFAAPSGGSVTAGNASITSSGDVTTITQSSNRASINWQDFSIRSNETVNFSQPSSSSITLNRVIGTEKSVINGMLNANGQVFILNSNGILFGKNSSVNTAGLVASTMSLSNENFMAGNYHFSENGSKASVVNEGTINISDGGYAVFLAQSVNNGGIVRASLGKVLLSSGEKITLKIEGNTLVDFTIDKVAFDALIENHGAIYANGGEIYLTTKAVDNLVKGVVNNTGILEAQTLSTHEGKIILWGESTNVAGTLDASAPDGGNGGFIETSGKSVTIAEGTKVTTKASNGTTGTWLIDPTDFTVAASGGDMSGATLSSNLGSTNVLIQSVSGSSGTNGDVNINDTVIWNADTVLTLDAANNINVNADITATGANAGLVMQYSGDYNLNAPITLSGVGATLTINGVNYTLLHAIGDVDNIDVTGLSGYYALGNDIVSSGTYGGALVGDFTGVFAGMGHTISDLSIDHLGVVQNQGLFRSNSGTIRNFGVINGSVQSADAVVGGLVGKNTGTIRDSFYSGLVSSNANGTGGLAGWNNSGTIKDSYSTGSVTGYDAVGGIAGYNQDNVIAGVINRTYSTAIITTLNSGRAGGIVGANNSGAVANSYATTQITGDGPVSGGGVLSAEQMKIATNFSGWDIATTGGSNSKWRIYEVNSTPLLRAFLRKLTVTADGGTRDYDGTTDGFGVTYSATPDATLLGTATTILSSKNVGTRTTSVSGLYSNQQGYDIQTKTSTATIGQKTVSIQDVVVADKTYDGTRDATITTLNVNGYVSGDDVATTADASFDTKNAGMNKDVRISGITVSGTDASNYWMADEFYDTTASIDQKILSIADAAVADKMYDGTRNATITALNVNGYVSGDEVTTTADASFDTKDIGTNKNVRVSGITVSGTDRNNYWMADEFYDTTASISAIPVTVEPTIQISTDSGSVQNKVMVNTSYFGTVYDLKEGWQNNQGDLHEFSEPYSAEHSPYIAFADSSDTKRRLETPSLPIGEHPVSSNKSFITLLDGGLNLPTGLNQAYYKNEEEK